MRRLGVFLMVVWIALSSMGQSIPHEATEGLPRGCRRDLMLQKRGAMMAKARRVPGATRNLDAFKGKRHQLVVLVSFADLKFLEADPLPVWNRIFNEVGYHEDSYVGSVHDYFYDQSYQQFDLTFDLLYVELSESRVKYRSTEQDDENSKYLINDIVDVLLTYDIDWSPYDWNDDGEIDQLLVVFAGKGMNIDGDKNSIWPHQWWLSEHKGCQPRSVSSDGKSYLIDAYCVVMETANNPTVMTAFGTLCHEYSHCFGLPDFYNSNTTVVREWDLMDYGCYNGKSFCPCNYSAHERMFMGWLTPTELLSKTSVNNLYPLSQAAEAYLVRNDGWEDEYYVLENRQQEGWDAYLPGSGLIIFHVDYDEYVWLVGVPNGDTKQPHYRIIPANNKTSTYYVKSWGYPYRDGDNINNALTNHTLPVAKTNHKNVDGSYFMSKPITNISVTNGLASFDFLADETGIEEVEWKKDDDGNVYNLQGQRLSEPAKGINIVGGQKVWLR